MAITRGPKIVRNGLVLALDAADKNSYIGSGANWMDMSGNVNNGTLINSPIFNTLNGGNFILDGATQYVTDSNIANFNVGCIDMWIRPSSTISASSIFSNLLQLKIGATDAEAWNIAFGIATGSLTNEYITIADGSTSPIKRTGVADGGSLLADTWHNIVFNWESNVYKIYINNIVKTTVAASGGNVGQLILPNLYIIGAFKINNAAAYNGFFAGGIGPIKIYNRTLTTTEILQNYNAAKLRFSL